MPGADLAQLGELTAQAAQKSAAGDTQGAKDALAAAAGIALMEFAADSALEIFPGLIIAFFILNFVLAVGIFSDNPKWHQWQALGITGSEMEGTFWKMVLITLDVVIFILIASAIVSVFIVMCKFSLGFVSDFCKYVQ